MVAARFRPELELGLGRGLAVVSPATLGGCAGGDFTAVACATLVGVAARQELESLGFAGGAFSTGTRVDAAEAESADESADGAGLSGAQGGVGGALGTAGGRSFEVATSSSDPATTCIFVPNMYT